MPKIQKTTRSGFRILERAPRLQEWYKARTIALHNPIAISIEFCYDEHEFIVITGTKDLRSTSNSRKATSQNRAMREAILSETDNPQNPFWVSPNVWNTKKGQYVPTIEEAVRVVREGDWKNAGDDCPAEYPFKKQPKQ